MKTIEIEKTIRGFLQIGTSHPDNNNAIDLSERLGNMFEESQIDFVKWMDEKEFSKSNSSDMWFSPDYDHMTIEEVYELFKNRK